MNHLEIQLSGGNVSTVVRIGDTVRRGLRPWSPAVHRLLRHLERQGFEGAPRFRGIDSQGREILTFIPGEVGTYPLRSHMWSDPALEAVARLLCRFHDATVGFVAPDDAPWQFVDPDPRRHEVICHNDVAPYNAVFVDGLPKALIDFDTAGPGPRIWDVAYAAYTFVPLASFAPQPDGSVVGYEPAVHAAERALRLRLFCNAYGLVESPNDLLPTIERRLHALCGTLIDRAASGDASYQRLIDEGHLDHYRREIEFLRHHGGEWAS